MRAVLLCAGYGTRLNASIENDKSGDFTHIKGIAKPLLPIHGIPLIGYWLKAFSKCKQIKEIVIVTNDAQIKCYENIIGQESHPVPIKIVSDGSNDNNDRSGAINCMLLGADDLKHDCLFVAGDTLLDRDFNLKDYIGKFERFKTDGNSSSLILSAPVKEEDVAKHGIIQVNEYGRVTSFIEKPQPSETTSRLQSPCLYLISANCLHYIVEFLKEKKEAPLAEKDATGSFICYLVTKSVVFAHHVSRRFDIGNLESYVECCDNFQGFH